MTRPVKIFLLFSFTLLALGGLLVTAWALSQDTYAVYVDGQLVQVQGEYETVAQVLAAANITTRPEDIIQPPPSAPITPDVAIQVQHATPITLRNENGTRTYFTHQLTLGAFLNEIGLMAQRTDQVYADGLILSFNQINDTPLPQTVEIGDFLTVTIHEGSQQKTVRTAVQTVGAAIQEAGITLYAADGVEPPPGSWLSPNLHIYIQRSQPYTILVDGRTIQTGATAPAFWRYWPRRELAWWVLITHAHRPKRCSNRGEPSRLSVLPRISGWWMRRFPTKRSGKQPIRPKLIPASCSRRVCRVFSGSGCGCVMKTGRK
ncbi:MAG: DUF348 domain-containing protein [Chloroflexi bacterium]|nr:DUF348 domain-containing protein [Chloroflexota bacterium]